LEDTFSEAVTILNIVLTSPVVTAGYERCFSALKRVKTCLRNTTGQDRLNAVSAVSKERDYISTIADFNKVTQKFAEQKNRRAAFLFK
jgi:hypothetical protein